MKKNITFLTLLNLWEHISLRRRRQFYLLLGLTVLSAAAEAISLGAIIPFIQALTQPESLISLPYMAHFSKVFRVSTSEEFVYLIVIAFGLAALIAGGLRLLLLWFSIRLTNATSTDLSINIYRRTLYQPYAIHVARGSSEIISGITQKVSIATSVMLSVVAVFTSSILFIVIMLTILAIDPVSASLAFLCFGSAYALIAFSTRSRLISNSRSIAQEQTKVIKALQEGLGAIRDVLIDGTQNIYCKIYQDAIRKSHRSSGQNNFISLAPRYVMEALGMALLAIFILILSGRDGGVSGALPILGVLALGAQRLLPLMQQLYGNWAVVMGSQIALTDVIMLLQQPIIDGADQVNPKRLTFEEVIQFQNVSFRYSSDGPYVLEDINFTIRKGSKVGFIGSTGSGKTTLLDLLMGLLEPSNGIICVDDIPINNFNKRAWQCTIAHVPQSIFLSDGSISENIAFGINPGEMDFQLVQKVAEEAQIAQFINSLPEGYRTSVGERGVRLSGGQRQRIGIARALYKRANILILDEATSALDSDTEEDLMNSIDGLSENITVLIIAHRITTLSNCDQIIDLSNGRIKRICSYSDLKFINLLSRE
jgi:ATP-binding cassette subfamily B protein